MTNLAISDKTWFPLFSDTYAIHQPNYNQVNIGYSFKIPINRNSLSPRSPPSKSGARTGIDLCMGPLPVTDD